MRLEDMTKEEILEAIDTYVDATGGMDPESIYTERGDIIDGPVGDALWDNCVKYREPLIQYVFRKYYPTQPEGRCSPLCTNEKPCETCLELLGKPEGEGATG